MLNLFPSNIAKTAVTPGGKIYAPILLDHVELDYYSSARKNASLEIPTTYAEFIAYLEKIQNEVEYPWLTNGSSDSALLDSVSVFALSYLGTDGYTQLCEELKTDFSRRKTLPHDLCIVLDEFKSLSRNKLSHRNWFVASENDIKNIMEWNQAGVISMRLSAHRKIPTNLVKNYEVNPFPPKVQEKSAIIIPELCAVILNDKNSEQEIVKHLVSQETQDSLSLVTGLAPSTLRAPAADRQADDVRFWAASNSNGIMPPIQNASFIQPAQISDLAEKIRNYLRN